MATQPNTLDTAQLQGIVSWLEEQQKHGRDSVVRLSQEVERLTLLVKEQASQIVELRGTIESDRATLQRLPVVDEAVRQEREQLTHLIERFDSHTQQITHALLLRAAEGERDRRQLGELSQLAAQLEREDQSLAARFRVLMDEKRRDRAQLTELPKLLDEIGARVSNLSSRTEQTEDGVRRAENLGAAQAQELDAIRAEQARAGQWRQLADLRASRQVAEWQQVIDNWRQTAEEQARPVQHLIGQVAQTREELRTATNLVGEQSRRLDDLSAGQARHDTGLHQVRDAQARLEQAMDGQRRRFDEQASAQLRLDEAIGRVAEHRQAVEATLQSYGRQLDELQSGLRAADAALSRARDELTLGQSDLRAEAESIKNFGRQNVERLEAAGSTFMMRMLDLQRLAQEHRSRLALELEQQSRELGELAARLKPT